MFSGAVDIFFSGKDGSAPPPRKIGSYAYARKRNRAYKKYMEKSMRKEVER